MTINLSFAGCGFLGIYHVGVASCFHKYAKHVLVSKIAGASVGSIAAAALLCDVSLGQTTTDILSVAVNARSRSLGALNPLFNLNDILKEKLEGALPQNAHEMCSGRLFISVTRKRDSKNVILSQFNTRDELIQALLCSCFIPMYSGMSCPYFQGEQYADGGMSDNLPVLDENTVTVSPFSGEHDICPQEESCNILQINVVNTSIAVSAGNMYRLLRVLFPPPPEILSKICEQGFDDALRYLQRKNTISCTKCLGVKSVIKVWESSDDSHPVWLDHDTENCSDCKIKRRMASFGSLPETVVAAIQETCDQVNKGIANWLFHNRPMRILKFLGLPYILPIHFTAAVFLKIWQQLPDFRNVLVHKKNDILKLIKYLTDTVGSRSILHRAMFSCEVQITEFNYAEDKVESSYNYPIQNGHIHDICNIKTEEEKTRKRKFSMRRAASAYIAPETERRQQRKSYAGFPNNFTQPDVQPVRRNSVSEINQPERVIRNMKFGFTVGVKPGLSANDKNTDIFQSLRSLGEDDNELNIMELAKKAIGIEREYMHQHCTKINSNNDETITNALNVTDGEPVMSYCYMDEDNTIKINEIYNVTDADTSLVLSDEERHINSELQWETNWINPVEYQQVSNISIVDSLDDHEFDTSDTEYDLTGNNEVFVERKESITENNNQEFNILKPHRKTSYVIVN